KLLHVQLSGNADRNKMQAYINYLLGMASGSIATSFYLSEQELLQAAPIDPEAAMEELRFIVEKMKEGLERLLVFGRELLLRPGEIADLTDQQLYEKIEKKMSGYQPQ